jgi:hypothetical protein
MRGGHQHLLLFLVAVVVSWFLRRGRGGVPTILEIKNQALVPDVGNRKPREGIFGAAGATTFLINWQLYIA